MTRVLIRACLLLAAAACTTAPTKLAADADRPCVPKTPLTKIYYDSSKPMAVWTSSSRCNDTRAPWYASDVIANENRQNLGLGAVGETVAPPGS